MADIVVTYGLYEGDGAASLEPPNTPLNSKSLNPKHCASASFTSYQQTQEKVYF